MPNVVVSYDTFGAGAPDPGNIHMWTTGYGDLTNVIYEEVDQRGRLEVTLTADPGFQVLLHEFDMAAFGSFRPYD